MILKLLDFLFPRTCVSCGKEGTYICEKCFLEIGFLESQECPVCRKENVSGALCAGCEVGMYFDQLVVCTKYLKGSIIQKLIIKFKYKFSRELRAVFGKILSEKLREFSFDRNFLVVPVPIHKKKLRMRGFNQTKLLAEEFATNSEKFTVCDCLECGECRSSQATLKKAQRCENLKGNFLMREGADRIKGASVILIDDVATTLATLNECSKVLRAAGVKYICGFVVGRGKLKT